MIQRREARTRTPEFVANMARERAEFSEILNNLGKSTLDVGYGIIIKTPLEMLRNTYKAINVEKYGVKGFTGDLFKALFGKDGAVHNTTKVVSNILYLSGKGIKIGIRKLFAI